MEQESLTPSIDAPHPFEHRRNLSDRGFSTCRSSCEQAIQLDWGDYWGDSPSRRACPRRTPTRRKPLSVLDCTFLYIRGYVIDSSLADDS